jgi:predicted deacylase
MTHTNIKINGQEIPSGSRTTIELPLPQFYTHAPLTMPVHVIHGRKQGPKLFVSAAIHGDELNGVEIIRRLLKLPTLKQLKGTLIAVPMVNIYGVIHHSRYLPDRRDLNRSFPGSTRGSLAGRLAHLLMEEIVANATHGIDFHTGAIHRANLPQIRANLDDPETSALAHAFGVPVLLNSNLRDGSLREAAAECGIPMLLYEAGEALRFDEVGIRAGVQGTLNVMRELGMLPPSKRRAKRKIEPFVARSSAWIRAPASGVLRTVVPLGGRIKKGATLAIVSDPFGDREIEVTAPNSGIVIGRSNIPLALEGEALFHIARFEDSKEVAQHVESLTTESAEPLYEDHGPPIV